MTTIVIPFKDQRSNNMFDYHLPGGRTIFVSRDLPTNTKAVLSEFCPILGLPKSAPKDRIVAVLTTALEFQTEAIVNEHSELVMSEHASDYSEGDEEEQEAERAYEEEWNQWLEETINKQNSDGGEKDPDATELPEEDDDGWLSPRVVAPAPAPMNIVEESNKQQKVVLRLRKNGKNEIIQDKPKLFVMKYAKFIDNEYTVLRMGEYMTEKEAVCAALRKMCVSGIFELTQRQKNKQHMGPEWVHLEQSLNNIKEDSQVAVHMSKYIQTIVQLQEYLNYVHENLRSPFSEKYGNTKQAYSWYFTLNGSVV